MATSQISGVLQHLRKTVQIQDGAGLTDGQLLEDYVSRHDPAALAVLVRRHGPMVWGVCRRVLVNYHDTEDAFQAAFLVLVRRASSIVPREMVVNWLYGVAHQTALKARATAARRRGRERQVAVMPELAETGHDLWRELRPLLDAELSRLPAKYRVVLVLCDLEGRTRKEAARQLGVPEGTVAGRLARARTLLARWLARHGLAVSGGTLAAVLAQNAASAGVPTAAVSSTIRAATQVAAGQTAGPAGISSEVALLTEGVVQSMRLSKRSVGMLLFVLASLAGATGLGYRLQAAERPRATADKEKRPAAQKDQKPDSRKQELQKLRGVWEIVSDPESGLDEFEGDVLVFKGDNQIRGMLAGVFVLDPSKKPARITITLRPGGKDGEVIHGIYELNGEVLKIAWSDGPMPPKELRSTAENVAELLVLKRLKLDRTDSK
jgi:RNA polymerase sigma factor (sigma-70 family)